MKIKLYKDLTKIDLTRICLYYGENGGGGDDGFNYCYDVVTNIADYAGNKVDVWDNGAQKWYKRNNLGNYEPYGIIEYVNDLSSTTYYVGKLVVYNNHEYERTNSGWNDLGEIEGEAAELPDVPFSVNVNAKDYDSTTKTFTKTDGQLVNTDLTFTNGQPTAVYDDHIHVPDGCLAPYAATYKNYFNRDGSNPNLTIISKTANVTGFGLLSNRDSSYNWMYRIHNEGTSEWLTLHGQSEYGRLNSTSDPTIFSARVDSNNLLTLNNWTEETSTTSSFTYGRTNNGAVGVFAGYGGQTSESFEGDFYWVYMSQNTLTDEQIQQVIDYNEIGTVVVYPKEYTERTSPVVVLVFEDIDEANAYRDCVYDGQVALIDGEEYLMNEALGEWVRRPDYLCFTALSDNSSVEITKTDYITPDVEYSLDNGTTWTSFAMDTPITLNGVGDKMYIRGNGAGLSDTEYYRIIGSGQLDVSGNIMSLLSKTDFESLTSVGEYAFYRLFNWNDAIVSAQNLKLPATTLARNCYNCMFEHCHSLVTAPSVLPATTLANYCYDLMFYQCTSLTTAPELVNATFSADGGDYNQMFDACSNLNYIKYMGLNPPDGRFTAWVRGVALSGTFVMNSQATWSPNNYRGDNGIPTTWTVYDENGNIIAYPTEVPDYLCFTANTADSTVGIANNGSNNPNVEYSTNNGATWTTLANNTPITLNNIGDKMYVRGGNANGFSTGSSNYTKFNMSGSIAASGNIMSLLSKADFESLTTIPNNYCFNSLFYNCGVLTTAPSLPATTLAQHCYTMMFYGCTSLTTAPSLPATTLANYCYYSMFGSCTSLTTAPSLPATALKSDCYHWMFSGCTSLTTAPSLPATTLADNCYYGMFSRTNALPDCSNIDFTSDSVVASGGLKGLFYSTKVTDADLDNILPRDANDKYCLPAATARGCYSNMFSYCKSLTTAPELPATTVDYESYYHMFEGCSSLTNVPIIPATRVGFSSCRNMFAGCTSLTTVPNNMLPATTLDQYCYQDMFNGCTSLTATPSLPATTLASECYNAMFKDCTSLTTAPALPATALTSNCYNSMFSGCTSLTAAPALPATTLARSCYYSMFDGCISLVTAPELPATTLANSCYRNMFSGCTSLTTAPALPATTLETWCYFAMFTYCTSLTYIKALFTTTPSSNYTTNWLVGVASNGTFVMSDDATWNPEDYRTYYGIPYSWTVYTESSEPTP